MPTQTMLAFLWLAEGAVLCALSLPLVAGRIPRNGLYGFRTPKTLGSDEVWYPANRYAGRQLWVAGVAIVVGAAAILPFAPALSVDAVAYLGLAVTIIPLAVAVVRSALYLRKL